MGNSFYFKVMQDENKDFEIKDSGFVIIPEHPHLGASADAISYYSCHGTGVVLYRFLIKSLYIQTQPHGF